jgi:cardiolipin synthase A/B
MSVVLVGLPVMQDTPKFVLDVGRRWNGVEHLILQALVAAPSSAAQLAIDGGLPRRVVVEAVIRLMRAGWVEMHAGAQEVRFNATARGRAVSPDDELPAVTERKSRKIPFVVDMVTGSVFRRRDLSLFHPGEWANRVQGRRACVVDKPSPPLSDLAHSSSLLSALLNEDESVVRVDRSDYPPVERVAMFVVRNGRVEGAPPRITSALTTAIVEAAGKCPPAVLSAVAAPALVSVAASRSSDVRPERVTSIRRDDFIVGGEAHHAHLTNALRKARRFVIVHSTFLKSDRFADLLPDFRTAADRRCKVDILWGEAKADGSVAKSLAQAEAIRATLRSAGLEDAIEVHGFSTRSHAKLLIADDGSDGAAATVGSCNWLYSGFGSFEVSLRLRDPHLVADVLYEVAELSSPTNGQFIDLTARFAQLARQYSKKVPLSGSARVRVLVGDEHDDRVLEARDKAASRVTVLSHRLGVTAKPAIIIPLAAAAKQRGVAAELFYGEASGPVAHEDAQSAKWEFKEGGVELVAVQRPRIHAKALLWDDDNVVVTSLNWLSADTPSSNPRQEIGVSVQGSGIARHLREEFDRARAFAE